MYLYYNMIISLAGMQFSTKHDVYL